MSKSLEQETYASAKRAKSKQPEAEDMTQEEEEAQLHMQLLEQTNAALSRLNAHLNEVTQRIESLERRLQSPAGAEAPGVIHGRRRAEPSPAPHREAQMLVFILLIAVIGIGAWRGPELLNYLRDQLRAMNVLGAPVPILVGYEVKPSAGAAVRRSAADWPPEQAAPVVPPPPHGAPSLAVEQQAPVPLSGAEPEPMKPEPAATPEPVFETAAEAVAGAADSPAAAVPQGQKAEPGLQQQEAETPSPVAPTAERVQPEVEQAPVEEESVQAPVQPEGQSNSMQPTNPPLRSYEQQPNPTGEFSL